MNRPMAILTVVLLAAYPATPSVPAEDLQAEPGFDAVWRRCGLENTPAIFSVSMTARGDMRFEGSADVHTKGVVDKSASRMQGKQLYRLAADSLVEQTRQATTSATDASGRVCISLTLRRRDGGRVTQTLSDKTAADFDTVVSRVMRLPELVCPDADSQLSSLHGRPYCQRTRSIF